MIRLLLALHPRAWRIRYGDEFRALLEDEALTMVVVLDVVCNAVRQHVAAHLFALRLLVALALSVLVEVLTVRARLTDNILWPPSTAVRALALALLVLSWLPVARHLVRAVRCRWPSTSCGS